MGLMMLRISGVGEILFCTICVSFTHHEHLIVDLAVKYFLMYCTQVEEEELNWTFRLQLKNNTWRVKKIAAGPYLINQFYQFSELLKDSRSGMR